MAGFHVVSRHSLLPPLIQSGKQDEPVTFRSKLRVDMP